MRILVLFGVIATGVILPPHTIGVAQDEEESNVLLREDFEVRSFEATPERNWAKLQSDSIALVDNVWVFLAGTFDRQDQKIYVNAKLDGTLANPGGYANNDPMLRIGWDPHAQARHFADVIDEVAIYVRALTPNEIEQNLNTSLGITSVAFAGKLSSTWGPELGAAILHTM